MYLCVCVCLSMLHYLSSRGSPCFSQALLLLGTSSGLISKFTIQVYYSSVILNIDFLDRHLGRFNLDKFAFHVLTYSTIFIPDWPCVILAELSKKRKEKIYSHLKGQVSVKYPFNLWRRISSLRHGNFFPHSRRQN